ncbi:MAG: 50S ribosomal protein L23 [Patescibacteria group bacterium]
MLFKKKDNAESSKAKNALFAKKSKVVVDDAGAKPVSMKGETKARETKALKTTIASGKVGAHILRNPRITEKASMAASNNVYVFDVSKDSTKNSIKAAIKDVYKITPVKVRVAAIPTKTATNRRGMTTTTGGGKKAYVYLKKGDTIELI